MGDNLTALGKPGKNSENYIVVPTLYYMDSVLESINANMEALTAGVKTLARKAYNDAAETRNKFVKELDDLAGNSVLTRDMQLRKYVAVKEAEFAVNINSYPLIAKIVEDFTSAAISPLKRTTVSIRGTHK